MSLARMRAYGKLCAYIHIYIYYVHACVLIHDSLRMGVSSMLSKQRLLLHLQPVANRMCIIYSIHIHAHVLYGCRGNAAQVRSSLALVEGTPHMKSDYFVCFSIPRPTLLGTPRCQAEMVFQENEP